MNCFELELMEEVTPLLEELCVDWGWKVDSDNLLSAYRTYAAHHVHLYLHQKLQNVTVFDTESGLALDLPSPSRVVIEDQKPLKHFISEFSNKAAKSKIGVENPTEITWLNSEYLDNAEKGYLFEFDGEVWAAGFKDIWAYPCTINYNLRHVERCLHTGFRLGYEFKERTLEMYEKVNPNHPLRDQLSRPGERF